jgi:AcrR family transcriptional regulator
MKRTTNARVDRSPVDRRPVDRRPVDRAAAVRRATRALVAERGFHGASMSAVARAAGVATGTAYVHYASKDAIVIATYLEVKRELAAAATSGTDRSSAPHDRFLAMWLRLHRHLAEEPDRARFLVQVDSSPYAREAHSTAMAADGDPLMAEAAAPDMQACLAPLPPKILLDLGFGPAVQLAAAAEPVDDPTLQIVAEACWRAITV